MLHHIYEINNLNAKKKAKDKRKGKSRRFCLGGNFLFNSFPR